MRINIKATNTSLTPAISDYVNKKIGALEKFIENNDAARCDVEIEVTNKHHNAGQDLFRAEVNLHAGDLHLRAEASHADLYAAIDIVKDEITREVVSKKKKRLHAFRRGGQKIKNILKGFYQRD